MRWGVLLGLALGLIAAEARADKVVREKVGRKMSVEVKDGKLYVVRGKVRAPLPTDLSPAELYGATVKKDTVEIEYEDANCQTPNSALFTLNHLEALRNSKTIVALRSKRPGTAALNDKGKFGNSTAAYSKQHGLLAFL